MEILQSDSFRKWMRALPDRQARARIQVRIDRLATGNPGDARPIGGGLSELRISHGPGYRVYYLRQGARLILLLCGGDKSSQSTDIRRAHDLARDWREQEHDHG
ncbi:MAG TPA: type II toxin-antitoxin system RelE/ParE family toxin [Propionibacterium sp.]|nr:type II toxin-antitoxin system RelE/ParE family toxin [Propionibacterium sp.]